MKNANDLKTFSPAIFGGGTIAGKGGDTGTGGSFNDGGGMVWTPGINPGGNYPVVGKGNLSKTIEVIDKDGNPLVNVHVKWGSQGTITNNNGEATITVTSESTPVTITHVGKRTHIAKFADLGSLITLQENVSGLPPVVVGQKPAPTTTTTTDAPKKSNTMRNIAIGVGAIFLLSAIMSKGKTGKASSAVGLAGTKSKKRKGGKKGKKRKGGLREPAAVTL